MKKILFIIIVVLTGAKGMGQAPSFQWAKSIGSTTDDGGYGVAVDASGNVYTTGYFGGTVDFDPGPGIYNLTSSGSTDIFIYKLDALGNFVWAKQIGGIYGGQFNEFGQTVNVDALGNIYISGECQGTADFDPGPGTYNLSFNFGQQFILKLNSLGDFVWVRMFIGGGIYNLISEPVSPITLDGSGNIYILGEGSFADSLFLGTGISTIYTGIGVFGSGTTNKFILKLDALGNVVWVKGIVDDFNNISFGGFVADASGNLFATGSFSGTVDFDPGPDTLNLASGTGTQFIFELDSSGNLDTALTVISNFSFDNMAVDAFDNLYVTGQIGGPLDCRVSKLDRLGNIIWTKTLVCPSAAARGQFIAVDATGNVYTTGYYHGSIDLDPNAGTYNVTVVGTNGNQNIFISKLDSLGNFVWGKSLGGAIPYNYPYSIVADNYGNAYIAGTYKSSPLICGSYSLPNADNTNTTFDAFIAKIAPIQKVWPGDANGDLVADNSDLLPIGLYYGQTGISRTVMGNVWQADSCTDWGVWQINGFDIKHADCNGDGTIDNNDTLAINQNFNLIHTIPSHYFDEEKINNPDIYFVTSATTYNPGDMVDVEVWAGSSTTPVSSLYGLAFNINYTTSLVQPGTESLTYPASWLGTPGADAIKIAQIEPLANTVYGAETRINHTNASGYGKIADFKFQAKTSISSTSVLHLSVSNYVANDSAGVPIVFNTISDSLTIHVSGAGINEANDNSGITIYPNPFTSQTTIIFNNEQKNTSLKITDVLGKEIKTIHFTGKQYVLEKGEMNSGVYFVEITDGGSAGSPTGVVRRKMVVE